MNELDRLHRRMAIRVTLNIIALIAAAISCVTATAVVALWIFGG